MVADFLYHLVFMPQYVAMKILVAWVIIMTLFGIYLGLGAAVKLLTHHWLRKANPLSRRSFEKPDDALAGDRERVRDQMLH